MAVINILKDGTVVEDMSQVTVPQEKIEQIMKMVEKKGEKKQWMKK